MVTALSFASVHVTERMQNDCYIVCMKCTKQRRRGPWTRLHFEVPAARFCEKRAGDCMLTGPLQEFEYALYDIDMQRLEESWQMLSNINRNSNGGRARIVKYTDRMEALQGARYDQCHPGGRL